MSKAIVIAFLFAVVAVDRISAQVTFPGPCPENVQSVETFDVERYLGIWYEYAKYPAAFEGPGSCIVAKYSLNEEGNLNVVNGMINNRTGSFEDIQGTATLVSPGKLMVKFPVSPMYTVKTNYWVLDTDYDNYAVVYSCTPKSNDTHKTFVWILTRDRIPSEGPVNEAFDVLTKNEISMDELKMTHQDDCDEFLE